jgi:tellurite resistance protein TehA-like permease
MFPAPTRKMFDTDVDQTTYLSCGTIAAATLVELVALIPGAHWNNWGYVAYALWWAVVALALLGGSVVYWILIRDEEVHLGNLSPTLLYPVTGILATSAAGAVVVSYNTDIGPRLGVGVVIVSYLLLGMGESKSGPRIIRFGLFDHV